MDFKKYTDKFQIATDRLDKNVLLKKQVEASVGVVLNSAFLKLYKKSWANSSQDPLTAESRIFFSIWINESAIKEQKIFYNIHALKPRKLKGYSIQSRRFADTFRNNFKDFDYKWENVRVDLGPLTLMEGWVKMDTENFERQVFELANKFLEIEKFDRQYAY